MEKAISFNDKSLALEDRLINESGLKRFIVDASVVLKWYYKIDEEDINKAESFYELILSEKHILLAPDLIVYEVLNVFGTKKNISTADIDNVIDDMFNTLILVSLDVGLSRQAFRISRDQGLSFYDSAYMAVSDKLSASLITADRKLFDSAKVLQNTPVLLSELNLA